MTKFIFIFSLAITLLVPVAGRAEPIAFIVNKRNSVDSISVADIKRIYLRKLRIWDSTGKSIKRVDRGADSPEFLKVREEVLKMGKRAYRKYWETRKILSGETKPRVLNSPELVVAVVAKDKSAIGYVQKDYLVSGLGQTFKDQLKVVAIIE